MATEMQKKAVDALVGNGGNVTQAMKKAGYKEATYNTPQKLTESDGFKELMEEYGLTDGLIVTSLVEDIQKKPQNRKPELELAAKIKGLIIERRDLTTKGKELPVPILQGISDVYTDDSDQEAVEAQKAD